MSGEAFMNEALPKMNLVRKFPSVDELVQSDDEESRGALVNPKLYDLNDKDHRVRFLAHLVEIIQENDKKLLVEYLMPMMMFVGTFDDSSLALAQALREVIGASEDLVPSTFFLPLLEMLCCNCEPKVASESVEVFRQLIQHNESAEAFLEHIVPSVLQLAVSPWVGARSAAVALLRDIFEFIPDKTEQQQIKRLFHGLCSDPQFAVRRSALSVLHHWVNVLSIDEATQFILPILTQFSHEENQDGVQVQLVTTILELSRILPKEVSTQRLLPLFIDLAKHKSWRARFCVAKQLSAFSKIFSSQALLSTVVLLAQDEESEVRSITASHLGVIAESGITEVVVAETIVPIVTVMAQDQSVNVRSSAGASLVRVCNSCEKSFGLKKVFPLIVKLLNDPMDNVRIQVIGTLWMLNTLPVPDVEDRLCAVLVSDIKSERWRIRQSVVLQLRQFSGEHITRPCFGKLIRESLCLLEDSVVAVRQAMVGTLSILSRELGGEWTFTSMLSLRKGLGVSSSFHNRQTFTWVLEVMLPFLEEKKAESCDELNQAISALANDPVSNVRLSLAKVLINLRLAGCKVLETKRCEALKLLTKDENIDVRRSALTRVGAAPF